MSDASGSCEQSLNPRHNRCDLTFLVYKDKKHINRDGRLGTKAEFCGAFYHTPERPTRNGINHRCCLNENNCAIAINPSTKNNTDSHTQPKTVVAFVKYEYSNGDPIHEVRYSNCYTNKEHAEDYFARDITNDICDKYEHIKKITMYITLQPCHRSIKGTGGTKENHSCCKTLMGLLENSLKKVEFCIKPTHLYKAGWTKRTKFTINAEEGIKMLMKEGVIFSSMEVSDWDYLISKVDGLENFEIHEERKELDKEIGRILSKLQSDVEKVEGLPNDVAALNVNERKNEERVRETGGKRRMTKRGKNAAGVKRT